VVLLDTDVCIYLLRGQGHSVARRLREMPVGEIGTTAITAAELRFGALRSAKPEGNMLRVEQFLRPIAQLPFDGRAGMFFARIKADLVARGQVIGPMDLLIAATALSTGARLVTHNRREYERIPRLHVESWRMD